MEIHDIAHFVVETELQFSKAFYGLLEYGYCIQDFELPREQRPAALLPKNMSSEALQTEHLVNLLQIQYTQRVKHIDLIDEFASILEQQKIPFPSTLDLKKMKGIVEKLDVLMKKWNEVDDGEVLELQFISN